MKRNVDLIKQTAKDYDMFYDAVEIIYDLYYPEKFYEKLEEFIKNTRQEGS